MCGISILINKKNTPVTAAGIRHMNDKVMHRGPDDEGYYFGDHFAFGHRRLSVIDTSSAGHQPMEKGNDCIVFNGMIYNYIELREELIREGYTFCSGTDTEVILAAYQHWHTAAFAKFNGMWAFGIYDAAGQNIILCRDHFGIKPLYYTSTADAFAAGSEIKQFTVLPGFKPVLNAEIAVNFLAKGWLNYSDETFFKGVQSLTPGHYLQYNLQTQQAVVHEWYSLAKAVVPVSDNFEQATATVGNLFRSSVQLRMRADVKLGACLSGGVDSSSIVSVVHAQQTANAYFTSFTSCYRDKKYDEQQYSDTVSAETGFPSIKIFPDLQQLLTAGDLDTMLYHQDQPFSSASHYSEFNVFKAAHQHGMKVMLDGQGSDEYLCGYPEFFTTWYRELMGHGQLQKAFRAIRLKGAHGQGVLHELKELLKAMVLYPLIEKVKKTTGKPAHPWMSETTREATKNIHRFHAKDVQELSIQQVTGSSIPYQLHSEDRNSMLFAIESRLPFLDHRLVEYTTGLPTDFKINKGYSKYILRMALPELPGAVRWRKDKLGFAAPDKEWILENHALIRKELELAITETPFFSANLLERFDRFVKGGLGYEPIYFRAMALNRFCRIFNLHMRPFTGRGSETGL